MGLQSLQLCIDNLLMRGTDDWIDASEVAGIAFEVGGAKSTDDVRLLALAVIRHVVQEGLVEVGDVTTDGFRRWSTSTNECIERVEREWNALGRNPRLSEIAWFQNTAAGDLRGQKPLRH